MLIFIILVIFYYVVSRNYRVLKIQDSLAASNQVAEEKISNIRTVKAFSQENKEMFLYGKKMNEVLQLSIKESFMRGLFFAMVTNN